MTTIQRQYNSPSCTLILEGFSDNTANINSSNKTLINILVNTECRFLDSGKIISGGRDFFESLVRTVSTYAQEYLSGLHHPQNHRQDKAIVHLEKTEDYLHRLTVEPKYPGQTL